MKIMLSDRSYKHSFEHVLILKCSYDKTDLEFRDRKIITKIQSNNE
jgi:hypothetical protein